MSTRKNYRITLEDEAQIRRYADKMYLKDIARVLGIKESTIRHWGKVHQVAFIRQGNYPLHVYQPPRTFAHRHAPTVNRRVEHMMELAEKASMKWIG